MRGWIRSRVRLLLLLLTACHARYAREAASIDAVRVQITTPTTVDVDLGRVSSPLPRDDHMADAANLDLWMQEIELETALGQKIDPDLLQSAFQFGIREQLGEGPPFRAVDDAPHTLDIQVVDWGLQVFSWYSPAVFHYKVRVLGMRPDESIFYRANFNCYGDPGPMRWLRESYGHRQTLKELDPAVVQRSFDRSAHRCGQAFALRLQQHAQ